MSQGKFIIKEKSKQIYISDGLINYPIKFFNNTISCLCEKYKNHTRSVITNQYDQKSQFCCHLLYYFNHCGLDLDLLDYWIRLRTHIVSELKINSELKTNKTIDKVNDKVNNSRLWEIVDKDILNAECPCCLEKIKNNNHQIQTNIHICIECQGVSHLSCYKKWEIKNKGCMLCRSGNIDDLLSIV